MTWLAGLQITERLSGFFTVNYRLDGWITEGVRITDKIGLLN